MLKVVGISLVEVLVSLTIISVAMLASTGYMLDALKTVRTNMLGSEQIAKVMTDLEREQLKRTFSLKR